METLATATDRAPVVVRRVRKGDGGGGGGEEYERERWEGRRRSIAIKRWPGGVGSECSLVLNCCEEEVWK